MAHDVFISYSTKDKPIADAVCAKLEAHGIRCWIAPRDILAGADWGEAIVEALDGSTVMVLVFSKNANESPQIKREVERAGAKGIAIIPFRIEDVPPSRSLEFYLGTPHWLDALSPPLERYLNQLAETLQVHLAKSPRKATATGAASAPAADRAVSGSELPAAGSDVGRLKTAVAPRIPVEGFRRHGRPVPRMMAVAGVLLLAVLVGVGVWLVQRPRDDGKQPVAGLGDQSVGNNRGTAPGSGKQETRANVPGNSGSVQPPPVTSAERPQTKMAQLLTIARASDSREKDKQALAALRELFKLEPQNADGLEVLTRIAARYGGRKMTNSIGMTFIEVKPGTFIMGSPRGEADREPEDNDETQHRVIITKPFWLGACEVTQSQWRQIMGGGTEPSRFSGDNLPVEQITWAQAVEFCKRLSQKEQRPYRLPTEAEWEYACRAETTTTFGLGATIGSSDANVDGKDSYAGGPKGTYRGRTTPAGSFRANAWGFCDMHGNVWEWCSDVYAPYASGIAVDPTGPVNLTAPAGGFRVHRGGAWSRPIALSRAACRGRFAVDKFSAGIGFRCAMDLRDEK